MEKKLLIIRLSSLGDVILTTLLPRIIKSKYPNCELHYLTSTPFAPILQHNPHIDKLFSYNKPTREVIGNMEKKYNYIFDLQDNKYSKNIASKIDGKYFKISKQNWKKFLLVQTKLNFYKTIPHVTEKYLDTASVLNLVNDGLGLEIWTKEEKETATLATPQRYIKSGSEVITLSPGAKHFTKRYPPEKYVEIIKWLKAEYNHDFVLLGSNDEIGICREIENALDFPIDNQAGKLQILETVKVIDKSKLLICNDSALMHVASARNTPLIAFFGSTVKEFGFFPLRENAIVLQKDISCRPCTHIGRKYCPKKHFRCLNEICLDDFIASYKKLF